MKIFIALLVVSQAFSSYSQVPGQDHNSGAQAPKKTYKIVVKNELTADQNFTLVGKSLAENDFMIEVKDKEFKTIRTASKSIDKTARGLRLLFSIRDHEISVTGQATVATFSQIVLKGKGGPFVQLCFEQMQEFAMKLGATVEFITE